MRKVGVGILIAAAGAVIFGAVIRLSSVNRSSAPSSDTGGRGEQRSSLPYPASATPPNILLITMDTLRADHLGCYGYFRDTSPNLDAFAKEAIVFDRAVSPMATTFPTHVSIMTGVHPLEHGYTSNTRLLDASFVSSPELRTVAEVLKEHGYATAAFVSAAPVRDATGLDAGFDHYSQPQKNDWKAHGIRRAGETNEAVYAWLAGRADREQPFFAWVHYFDPHWPYDPPPPYDGMFTTDGGLLSWLKERRIAGTFAKWAPRDAADIHNAYDGEIRYMDDRMGELFDRLRRGGWWDRTIVVVTADHGEALGQHGWHAHGRIHGEQINAPLLIRLPWDHPGQPGRVDIRMSLIDVFPTVFGLVGPPLEGLMARQATGGDVFGDRLARPAVFSQRADREGDWEPGLKFALTTRRWRYFHLTEGEDQLFDLTRDPHEFTDVIGQFPDIAERLRREILQRIETYRARGRARRVETGRGDRRPRPDASMKRDLEALGYIDSDDP